jgi:hypothetical protein
VNVPARWIRVAAFALIAMMVLMPPLVRATQHLAGSAASQIRLNRGFDLPENRCDPAPAVNQPSIAALIATPAPQLFVLAPVPDIECLPGSPAFLPFDPLRGPPPILNI